MSAPDRDAVRQVLVDALALLGPEGERWTKGAFFRDARGGSCFGEDAVCMCADAALRSAVRWSSDRRECYPAAAAILAAAWRPESDEGAGPEMVILGANDADETTFPHVRSAFERAIASVSDPVSP